MANDDNLLRQIAESIARLEELLDKLPSQVAKDLRQKVTTLRSVLLEQRPPALGLIGRRGSGKSSLVNALFGAKVAEVGHVKAQTGRGRWFDYNGPYGTLAILDTRGIHEGSSPTESTDAATPIESIVLELRKKVPDVLVFLVKATEVDAAIDADLDALERVLDELERGQKVSPPVLGVLTHCDQLEPKNVRLHAAADEDHAEVEEKMLHVTAAERHLDMKMRRRPRIRPHLAGVLGVSTYMSWRAPNPVDGRVEVRADERWRIPELAKLIFEHLPNEGRGTFARIARVRALQEELASTLTMTTATLCAGIAATPLPVADLVPITTAQVALVAGIAWISGRAIDSKAAGEFLAGLGVNVGAAFALREAARALIKYVFPGGGSAVSGIVAFAGTMAIGAAARAYFMRGVSFEEAKRVFRRTRDESK